MWRIYLLLFQLFCFLSDYANCETKPHPIGEYPVSVLGPTIIEKSKNKPEDDAAALKKAFDNKDFAAIAQLIGDRTLAQRLAIATAYKTLANEDISKSINRLFPHKADGGTRRYYSNFFLELPRYIANCFALSIDNWLDWVHLSIVCTGSATRLTALKKGFLDEYSKDINKVIDDSSIEGKDMLKQMLDPKTMRPDSGTDDKLIDSQVALIPKDKDKCNSDDLLKFMTSSSFDQIKNVTNKWIADNKNADIVQNFRDNCEKGYRQEAFKRIVRFARDPYQYFSEEFHNGYYDVPRALRAHEYLVTSRCEIDLKDIIVRYNNNNKADLIKDVKGENNGYKTLLAAVLVGNAG